MAKDHKNRCNQETKQRKADRLARDVERLEQETGDQDGDADGGDDK